MIIKNRITYNMVNYMYRILGVEHKEGTINNTKFDSISFYCEELDKDPIAYYGDLIGHRVEIFKIQTQYYDSICGDIDLADNVGKSIDILFGKNGNVRKIVYVTAK